MGHEIMGLLQTTISETINSPFAINIPGEGNDNPLQYPCLENPTDREAWWATAHEGAELDTTVAT